MSTDPGTSTAGRSTGRIDFTLMYVTHDAFRRDLARLRRAAAEGRTDSVGVRLGWATFKQQLHVHHTAEDEALWPRVEAACAGRPDAAELLAAETSAAEILAAMAAEHASLDPLLEAVDAALEQRSADPADPAGPAELAGPADLVGLVGDLEAALGGHMKHEEDAALPLIQEVLSPDDWAAFGKTIARKQKLSGAAVYVPWVIDGADEAHQAAFFHAMPAPVKVLNRLFWGPRHRRRHPWV
ncbi:hemerythrin domain-containing protein [Catenulispora sp. NF23]|uniref:Hemerythrin domain-containing protein n=1 Tax=Catenulispora pinistramenti TaxID=2705254 RepID=A0ABS5KMI1_9ACTN|nr:hemerythrin domain-containing protein [Catenulispora pinistramenti]MBS2532906.1 hemerythrin domain-containing protein [Catenulispora pinistramenti]MBS2547209.1 hemerythrin domain-containing protein [Catenulispora pinistramenti]